VKKLKRLISDPKETVMKDTVTFGAMGMSYSLFFTIWHLTFPDLHIDKMGYWSYLLAVALWAGILASSLLTLARFRYSSLVLGILGSCSVLLYYSTLTGLKSDPESPLRPEKNILSQFVMIYLLVSQWLGHLLNLYLVSYIVRTMVGHIPGLWDAMKSMKGVFPSNLVKNKQAEIESLLDKLELEANRIFNDSRTYNFEALEEERNECDKNLSQVQQLEEEIQAMFGGEKSAEDQAEADLISTKNRAEKFVEENIRIEPTLQVKTLRDLIQDCVAVHDKNQTVTSEKQDTRENLRTEPEVNRRASDGKESNLSDSFEIMDRSL
jgi:hypothetical protein